MVRKHCLIMTVEEVKSKIREYMIDLSDMYMEAMLAGGQVVPPQVFEKGIDNLNNSELIDLSECCGWADTFIEKFNAIHIENPIVAIIMFDQYKDTNSGQSFLLTGDSIYGTDMKNPLKQ